jgi:hypothetical protein
MIKHRNKRSKKDEEVKKKKNFLRKFTLAYHGASRALSVIATIAVRRLSSLSVARPAPAFGR